ncbi:putative ABC transport system permease protein [Frankia sp. EI5c]|uniref:ABC transporter permease n=1 Tax=Frankia sp. EI5c TaxID=683316 RepID=UPI0007C24C73|nr:ABC transporter permease [Frankia sp. EI5c]OAA27729.1 putative ABC transport system permease protein [Frankia sp. EI5c]
MNADLRLAAGLGLLLALAVGCQTIMRLRVRTAVVTASARAFVQLAAVGLAVRLVFAAPAACAAVLAVMATVAAHTAARRLSRLPGAGRAVVIAIVAAAALTLGVLFAVPALPRSARYLVALGGSVLGGTMTACTLAGRRLLDGLLQRRDEVEAWLALGATPRQAVADIARTAATEALLPALDQTRTVGLVTLPGAFVGALLGGASPTEAARFQLVVLISLLAAETYAAAILVWLLGAPTQLPAMDHQQTTGRRAT